MLEVSGSAEGKIPTKEGVQILWEIRPCLNIPRGPGPLRRGEFPGEVPIQAASMGNF